MRVTALIRKCLILGFHPRAWKTAKWVMLRKPNKINYTLEKSYRVMILLNCLGNVCEKVAAEMLKDWCEVPHILFKGQMRSQRQQGAIEAVSLVIKRVQDVWTERKLPPWTSVEPSTMSAETT